MQNSINPDSGKDLPGLFFASSITLPEEPDPTEAKKWSRFSDFVPVYVVCFSERGFSKEKRHGVQFYTYPARSPLLLRLFYYYLFTPFIISSLALGGSIKVAITQSPYEAGAVWGPSLILKPLVGLKVIVEAHGDWIESFFELRNLPFESIIGKFLKFYSSLILRRADGLRSVSEKTRALLEEFSPSDRPHRTFPTFTNLDLFLQTTKDEKINKEQDSIIYIGALTHLKGVEDLLHAIKKCNTNQIEIPFQIVGNGPQKDYFEEISCELNLNNQVQFLGRVPQKKVRELLLRSRFLVLPSHTEGMPRVLIESLACYTPYISTKTPGGIELTGKSDGGLTVPIQNINSLAKNITNLYTNKLKRRELGKKGRSFVEEHYSTEAYFQNYLDLVKEIL